MSEVRLTSDIGMTNRHCHLISEKSLLQTTSSSLVRIKDDICKACLIASCRQYGFVFFMENVDPLKYVKQHHTLDHH